MEVKCLTCEKLIITGSNHPESQFFGGEKISDPKPEDKHTKVDHPEHYQGKHECIDVMRALFGDEAVKGFCKCNAFKYRFRAGQKGGEKKEDDIAKAEWYEDYLINNFKEEDGQAKKN